MGVRLALVPKVAFPPGTPSPVTVQAGSGQMVKATATVKNTGGQQANNVGVAGAIVPSGSNAPIALFFYWTGSQYQQIPTVNLAPGQTATLDFYAAIPSSAAPGAYDAIWRAGIFQNDQWVQVHDEGRHNGVVIVQAAPAKAEIASITYQVV